MLANIRDYLLKSGIKMKSVSVEMIDAVRRFEAANVLSVKKNMDALIAEQ